MNQRLRWGQIGKGKTEAERVRLRRKKLESLLGKKLTSIGSFCLDAEKIKGRNLENMIGVTQVPLGVAGPVTGYYIPLATTEGALVASINRGCKVIEQAGGCQVMVEEKGTTRGPVFRVEGIVEGQRLRQWLDKNLQRLQQVAKETDKHTKLLWLESRQAGRNVFVRFGFNTAEAMGMNMVTVATDRMVKLIEKKLKIECVSLSGNYCVDKKASWLNFISGRGKQVWAEVVVPEKTVRRVLRTTGGKIAEVVYRKQLLGSVMSGSVGFNGHYANMVAAMFLATGQDMAHVVEGSLGVTTAEVVKGGLYFSIYLPSLMVGTVGGGTGLATQKEGLKILGLDKVEKGDGLRLAEAVGGAVLAGELSLTAALASGDLARAHKKLGRGRK